MKLTPNKYASLSLISTILTGTLISIHHAYEIGFHVIILLLLFLVTPTLLMRWFRNTGSRVALWVYGLLNTWLVFGFGLVDGLWNHIIRPLGFQLNELLSFHGGDTKLVEKAVEGNFIYNGTGVLTFIAAMFTAFYGYKFIRLSKQSEIMDKNKN